ELIGPQIDPTHQLIWIASLSGDLTGSEVRRFAIRTGKRSSTPLPPIAGDPVLRTAIAGASDHGTLHYLASGLVPLDELPCTAQSFCLAEPGCSETQPC